MYSNIVLLNKPIDADYQERKLPREKITKRENYQERKLSREKIIKRENLSSIQSLNLFD
jgi:hypothetical protein